jgi:hypothetical protein
VDTLELLHEANGHPGLAAASRTPNQAMPSEFIELYAKVAATAETTEKNTFTHGTNSFSMLRTRSTKFSNVIPQL